MILSNSSFSQRIVEHVLLWDIDYDFNAADTSVSRNKFSTVICYRHLFCKDDSVVLKFQKKYNSHGNLIEFVQGEDLNRKAVDFRTSIKRLSPYSYDAVTLYPKLTSMPKAYILDTTINNVRKEISLYKLDPNNQYYVRSLYQLDSNLSLIKISRYDIDSQLVQVFYPSGIPVKTIKKWSDTLVTKEDSIVTFHDVDENGVESINKYEYWGSKLNTFSSSSKRGDEYYTDLRYIYSYSSDNTLMVRRQVDDSNKTIIESRYYFNKGKLIRFTADDNFDDDSLFNEVIYDAEGKTLVYKQYNQYHSSMSTYTYEYDKKGLLSRTIYYFNGEPQYCETYKYKRR